MTQINFSRAGAILLLALGALWGCSATPVAKGVVDGGLADCPSTPNCISSNANDEDHRYPPLPYSGTPEQAISKLIQVIRDYPRTDIVKQDGPYLYATFTENPSNQCLLLPDGQCRECIEHCVASAASATRADQILFSFQASAGFAHSV